MKQHDVRQYSDEIHCHICGKVWDVNDPDPPECVEVKVTSKPTKKINVSVECEKIRDMLRSKRDD